MSNYTQEATQLINLLQETMIQRGNHSQFFRDYPLIERACNHWIDRIQSALNSTVHSELMTSILIMGFKYFLENCMGHPFLGLALNPASSPTFSNTTSNS